MENSKYAAIFPVVVGGLVNKIIAEGLDGEDEAFGKLYGSELYAALENEKTKLWTYSSPRLFQLYQNELNTGELKLPDY